MDHRRAEFVRFVADSEPLEDLIDEAKADTWKRQQEHALLVIQTGGGQRFVMVRGGRDGILLDRMDDEKIGIEIEGEFHRVVWLGWHVPPVPTGPSDYDRLALDLLGQPSSMLYEVNGARDGTRFTRMSDRRV
jgi:hypothetical protein